MAIDAENPITFEKYPVAPPSYVGNAAVVLVIALVVFAMAAVISSVLSDACSWGCP